VEFNAIEQPSPNRPWVLRIDSMSLNAQM